MDQAGLASPAPRLAALSSVIPKVSASLDQGRPHPLRVGSLLRLAIHGTRPRSLIRPDPNERP
ncbi:hypothetical protein DVH02_32510 [Streptomyces corynorhini]|uniref:Uncharacterized protein n=1 Tax=Streptomyces corynorhini TaxID=2282652 RepID=A0A370AY51_9ACTN|nr:hypothetical protein DVH02_32510 [Streptomyces corynorhini]